VIDLSLWGELVLHLLTVPRLILFFC
jgi:hypothetical protein